MKKLVKLLALLLALALVCSFAACGESGKDNIDHKNDNKDQTESEKEVLTEEEMLLGVWSCRFDVSESIGKALLGADAEAATLPVYAEIVLDFQDDGVYTTTMELDRDSLTAFVQDIADDMVALMYKAAEAEGISQEDYQEQIRSEYGMDVAAYVDSELAKYVDTAIDAMSSESATACYKLDKQAGYIYVAGTKENLNDTKGFMEYTLSETQLTVSKLVNNNGNTVNSSGMGMELPWNFEKK